MAIDVFGDGSRYTSTQTQSFRRAPMGELGVASDYVPVAQTDALGKAWDDLILKFYALAPVSKSASDQFGAIQDAYLKWSSDNYQAIINNKAPGYAAQLAAFDKAKAIYASAVAAGAKPGAVVKSSGRTITAPEEKIVAGTGLVLVVLGLAFVLLTWQPRRRGNGAMAGLGQPDAKKRRRRTVHLEFPTGHTFTRFRVQASQKPEGFGHRAEDGSWVVPEREHMERFKQLLRDWGGNVVGEGEGSLEGLDGIWAVSKHPHLKRGPRYSVYHEPSGLPASKRLTHKQAKELMQALEERFPNLDPSDQSSVREVAAFVKDRGAIQIGPDWEVINARLWR